MAEQTLHTETGAPAGGHSVGMPQLNTASFASQLFWLTITFIALYVLISRSALPRIHDVLEKRQGRINADIMQSEAMARQAEEIKAAYERAEAEAKARSNALIAEVEKEGAARLKSEQTKLDAELSTKLADAARRMTAKRQEIRASMQPVAEELAQAIIEKITGVQADQGRIRALVEAYNAKDSGT